MLLLCHLGAEVIKVERPCEGDDTHAFAPPFQGDQAAYFLSVNRNKRSITLDVKSERGYARSAGHFGASQYTRC
jgi:crotonobetainyl-CoA:carnitine CoA-transferase CaiB-like acyl-CoA transferase